MYRCVFFVVLLFFRGHKEEANGPNTPTSIKHTGAVGNDLQTPLLLLLLSVIGVLSCVATLQVTINTQHLALSWEIRKTFL